MASADCECCGAPATEPDPVVPFDDQAECDCDCFDCTDCDECYHDEPEPVVPVVLCHHCMEDGPDGCLPGAWHCRCGRSCDGSACPGEPPPFRNGSTCGPDCASHGDLRGPDDGGSA